ncbi:hypothetical protein GUY61_30915, partial [Streptomyces sp. GC420]|nr:hypothetical protein [Streptomyces sp. GC420]
MSIRVCDSIARCATGLADWIRSTTAGELPSAQALLGLGDTALTYSTVTRHTPAAAGPPAPPVRDAAGKEPPPEALRTGRPRPYGSRDEALRATETIARAFQSWAATDMGQQLVKSSHPRVVAFRNAWGQLPGAGLPTGPGPAAGRYGEVAERAAAVAGAAVAAARFTAPDVAALRLVAKLAETHADRLAVTLPGGTGLA